MVTKIFRVFAQAAERPLSPDGCPHAHLLFAPFPCLKSNMIGSTLLIATGSDDRHRVEDAPANIGGIA